MDPREIVAGIIAGKDMRPQIWERNVRMSIALAEMETNNQHDPKGCKRKNCVHGNPEIVSGFIAHAGVLHDEMVRNGWI